MIEQFKVANENKKEKQIAQKSANVALLFKQVNNAQKLFESRAKREAQSKEKLADKEQLLRDMVKFDISYRKVQQSRVQDKKQLKSQLFLAMKNLEERRESERKHEALLYAQQKEGPPMMVEMDTNERKAAEQTKLANRVQGEQNYLLMLGQRQQVNSKKLEEIADYKAKYQEDLMARLT